MDPNTENNTAILIFANSPEVEVSYKPLPNGVQFFHALTDRTIQTVKATGIPYYHYSENDQQGKTFGERLVNAIWSVFERGYSRVITLGNDSPQLKVADILRANDLLTREHVVLGPSADGGCYLLGLNRSHVHSLDLKNLPWHGADLARTMLSMVKSGDLLFARLRTLYDLDTVEDIRSIGTRFRNIGKRIGLLIQSLLQQDKRQFQPIIVTSIVRYRASSFNKGSPFI